MLDMLVYFDFVCTKNDIPYFMIGGTLIGALRHQGWIPWDMDIDVAVLERDLPRLKNLLMETMPPTMFYQDSRTDPHYRGPFPKIRNRHSNYYEWQEQNPGYKHHNGLQLDIFPYRWVESKQHYEGPGALRSFQKDDMFPLTRMPFEKHSFLGPHKARALMEKTYGTLDMPPPDK
jgi:phosphorylcholine metabolism protein LicD